VTWAGRDRAALRWVLTLPLVLSLFAAGTSGAPAAQKLERFYIRRAHVPSDPVQGPDGAVWFTLDGAMGRVSADGRVTVFRTPHLDPFGTPANLDGDLWFLDGRRDVVSRIDLVGHARVVSRRFPKGALLWGIATGADGNLWITEAGADAIARMTPSGRVTQTARLPHDSFPTQITAGSDGSLWFSVADGVGRVTPAGTLRLWKFRVAAPDGPSVAPLPDGGVLVATGTALRRVSRMGTVTRLPVDRARLPQLLASGNGGAVWFTFIGATSGIGRMAADGTVQATWRDRFGATVDQEGLALDAAGDVWVTDSDTDSLERLSPLGREPGPLQPLRPRAGRFRHAGRIVAGPDGAMWVALGDRGVVRIDPSGIQTVYRHGLGARVVAVAPLREGGAWLATGGRSLVRLRADGSTRRYARRLRRHAQIWDVAADPHGSVWFIDGGHGDRIGRLGAGGRLREFTRGLGAHRDLLTIRRGPDNRMWVTDQDGAIDAVSQSGRIHRYTRGLGRADTPTAIVTGPDGNLWFTEHYTHRIGRITPAGRIRLWRTRGRPASIAAGPDGALWFNTHTGIGRITLHGHQNTYFVRDSTFIPYDGLAAAPDGKLWFTELSGPTAVGTLDPRRLADLGDVPGGVQPASPVGGRTKPVGAAVTSGHTGPRDFTARVLGPLGNSVRTAAQRTWAHRSETPGLSARRRRIGSSSRTRSSRAGSPPRTKQEWETHR
jgi:virginiamycin B lyase